MKYRHHIFIVILAGICPAIYAHVNTPRTFHNDADKKIRLSLWYKRYKHRGKTIHYENRMRRYTTYVKPGRTAEITLRATGFEDLEFCYVMATNTRRRNEWAALTYNDLQTTNEFRIAYDKESKDFTLTPLPRNAS
jgi:hypothetical protein